MESETLIRYRITNAELLEKLGIDGQLHFINGNMDDTVIIEVLIKKE